MRHFSVFDHLPQLSAFDTIFAKWRGVMAFVVITASVSGAGLRTLHHFSAGSLPTGRLAVGADEFIYGVLSSGGPLPGDPLRPGAVYRLKTDGSGFAYLHYFTGSPDGQSPAGGPTLVGGSVYGTTIQGGENSAGAIYRMNADGTDYRVIYHFPNSPGPNNQPVGTLQAVGDSLFGMANGARNFNLLSSGFPSGGGVFRIGSNGSGYTMVRALAPETYWPTGDVLVDGTTIYGQTAWGGSAAASVFQTRGTIFRMNTDGTGYRLLHAFAPGGGLNPNGTLAKIGNVLYGMTTRGGPLNFGILYRINTDGTGYSVMREFAGGADGAFPDGGVVALGNVLIGTTASNGGSDGGTLFKINADGSGYAILHAFSRENGSRFPSGGLFRRGTRLFGLTMAGGQSDRGIIFSFDVAPGIQDRSISTPANVATSVQLDAEHVPGLPTTLALVTSPRNGSLTGSFPNFVYTPRSDFAGADTITYRASNEVAEGTATVTVNVLDTPPVVVPLPTSVSATAGESVTLTVAANSRAPLQYQWSFNGAPIAGATQATLTLVSATVAQSGSYRVQVTNNGGTVSSTALQLTITASARLANLSTRAFVGSGEDVLVVGFVVQGTTPKSVLVRGVGPALRSFDVSDALAAPQLQLFRDSVVVASNSGWSTAANAAAVATTSDNVGAFAYAPGSADSALLAALEPRGYTAIISAPASGSGVALAEVYEAGASEARLINLSTRAFVGAGDRTLIVGFVVAGNAPARLLVRAIGPALGNFGVGGAVTDPELEIQRNETIVATNDNWEANAALVTASERVGAFALPAGSRDAAVLVSLEPGAYSVLVRGVGVASGVGLAEVYHVP